MKRLMCLMLAVVFVAAMLFAGQTVPPPYPGPRGTGLTGQNVYTVVKGDTLWEICQAKLGNAWLWVKVWERNPHITDPNWIYPGDRLELDVEAPIPPSYVKPENKDKYADEDRSVREFVFMEEQPSETTVEPEKGITLSGDSGKDRDQMKNLIFFGGFILENGTEPFAKIMSIEKDANIAAYGDYIYINKGGEDGIKEGDELIVYQVGEKVTHPVTFKKMGYIVKPLGLLKVVSLYKDLAKCEVTGQQSAIRVGDFVDYEYPRIVLNTKNIKPDYQGNIIYFKDGSQLAGKNTIVHIDRGMKQGIKAGMFFDIFGEARKVRDPDGGSKEIPAEIKGRIKVINARENVSMGVIMSTRGDEKIMLGDEVVAE